MILKILGFTLTSLAAICMIYANHKDDSFAMLGYLGWLGTLLYVGIGM